MTWALPILSALFAVAAIVSLLRFRSGANRGLRALHAALKARGIGYTRADSQGAPVAGDSALVDPLLGIVLARTDGVRASVLFSNTHGAATVPGFASVDGRRIPPPRLLVELPLALPNQMICARERAAAVFGPFPPPTVTTGHPGFDRRFGVYLPKNESAGYRSEPADATPWARAASAVQLLANLDTLQFQALHVHEGRGRAVFEALSVDGMVAAMDATAAFGRPVPCAPLSRAPLARRGNVPLLVLLGLSLLMMFWLPLQTWLLAEGGVELAGASIACPQGGTFHEKSKRYGASCTGTHGERLPVDQAGWERWRFAFFAPLALGMGVAMVGARAKRQRDLAREALSGLL